MADAEDVVAAVCIISLIAFGGALGAGIQSYRITKKYCKVMYSQTADYIRCVNTSIFKNLERTQE